MLKHGKRFFIGERTIPDENEYFWPTIRSAILDEDGNFIEAEGEELHYILEEY